MKRCFPLRLETTQEYTLSPYLFNIMLQVLTSAIRKRNIRKKGRKTNFICQRIYKQLELSEFTTIIGNKVNIKK